MNCPSVFKQGYHWYLNCGENTYLVSPANPMFDRIWKGVSKMLDVYADDCGANLDRCVQFCEEASKLFAEVSQRAADLAVEYKKQIELNKLYAPDKNEPWYNK